MSTMSTIVIPVVVALVSGVAGSGITTYGAQTKERRDARSTARKSLTESEVVVGRDDEPSREKLAGLESSAFTAGIPYYLIEMYRAAWDFAAETRRDLQKAEAVLHENVHDEQAAARFEDAKDRSVSADLAASLVSGLLLRSLWHPWLARFTRYQRCHDLRRVLSDLDHDRAHRELETRRRRKSFVDKHVKSYLVDQEETRRKEKAAKAALRSAPPPSAPDPVGEPLPLRRTAGLLSPGTLLTPSSTRLRVSRYEWTAG